jgi:hypothetical protein
MPQKTPREVAEESVAGLDASARTAALVDIVAIVETSLADIKTGCNQLPIILRTFDAVHDALDKYDLIFYEDER